MSIKIYDGIRFKNKDIRSLLDDFVQEKKFYIKSVHDYFITMVLQSEKLMSRFNTFEQGLSTIRNLESMFIHYFETSFVIFPFENKFYGISFYYGNRLPFKMKYVQYEDFSYWDNADKPNKISDKEWQERYRVWSAVLIGEGRDGVPINNGFSFTLFDKRDFSPIDIYDKIIQKRGGIK